MSDASTPAGDGEKSLEQLKAELAEVGHEIDEARHEAEAEHPKVQTFVGDDADGKGDGEYYNAPAG